jgi:hypothetical protein
MQRGADENAKSFVGLLPSSFRLLPPFRRPHPFVAFVSFCLDPYPYVLASIERLMA